jgi:hypothetical protein
MLARRFTIVCLVVMLFGMMLSSLVARTTRPTWESTLPICVFGGDFACASSNPR